MNFPITITDQQELNRLIRDIAKVAATETAETMMLKFGKIKTMMTKADCYRESTRAAVDKAIKNFQLKFVFNSGKMLISREDFNNWKSKNSLYL